MPLTHLLRRLISPRLKNDKSTSITSLIIASAIKKIERSQSYNAEYILNPKSKASISQKTDYRKGSRRYRKASRKARDNLLSEDKIPLDNDVLLILHTITTAISDDSQLLEKTMKRPDWD
jgi:hypothetical protein